MKKRVLAIILAVVMIISAVGVTSFVKGNTVTTTEDVTAEAGSTVSPAEEKGEPTAEKEHDTILLTDTEDGISATSRLVASTGSKAEGSEYTPVGSQTAYVDENNALPVPYDVAYPEAFASEDCQYATDTILVKCKPGFNGKVSSAMKKAGIVSLEELFSVESGIWYSAGVSGDVQTVMAAVRQIEQVVVAEYNYIYESSAIVDTDSVIEDVQSNVQCFDQWHLRSGHLQNSWSYMKNQLHIVPGGDSSVVVAVIDTGVDYTHEDLKDNIWVNSKEIPDNGRDDDGNGYVDDYYGVNLETKKGSGMDDHGHGTHVAGIVAARNNNIGVVGVAYNVKVMPVKAGMASGFFNQAQIAAGIIYAYENGADVINMSFGGSASTIAVQDALETAYTRCVLVAAAGNNGKPNEGPFAVPNYPGALAYVLGVMSVDSYGVESYFTNYDVVPYSSVEYEVYAPGSQILSTIPGNRYAAWSGTSMAAPYVSAVAALLRSAYPDRNTYPTKFIYGQIAATGEESASCCDPKSHGRHNLPKIVDVYNALTKLPKPEVSPADFVLFDDVSLSVKNNGDGVIDAGETVAIGFTMRNRWGAAKDVTIHLDATNDIGLACPYITFPRNDVNYGHIGTYATQDYGKTRDGEFVTGLDTESSLLFTVAEDCPNDYIIRVNLTVTCRNDLDEKDHSLYTGKGSVLLTVRRGVILPNLIDRDMTLTAENYYIIPNATTILAGATVTVEPGTQIQFWSDDPHDQYADTAIAYLRVEGTLLCQGTAENHIRMFPSQLMSTYLVQLYENNGGCIKLWYTDVVNPVLGSSNRCVSYAYGCEFSQNYRAQPLYYRYLDSGTVRNNYSSAVVAADEIESCAFYIIGGRQSLHKAIIFGKCRDCIFVDSAVSLLGSYNIALHEYLNRDYTGCVFLGNNNYLGEIAGGVSAYSTLKMDPTAVKQIITDPTNGTTYVALEFTNVAAALRLVAYLGGHLCCMETAEEQAFLQQHLNISKNTYYVNGNPVVVDNTRYLCGLQDTEGGTQRWITGDQAQVSLNEYTPMVRNDDYACEYYWYGPHQDQFYGKYGSGKYLLAEFPDSTVTDILLQEGTIQMDTGMTYQLYPEVAPLKTALVADLRYQSLDEAVVTVSQSGLITPVSTGGTVVRVSNSDGSVYKDVAVHVVDGITQTAPAFGNATVTTALTEATDLGDPAVLFDVAATFAGEEQPIQWTVGDETVAGMDENGHLTARAAGVTTVTAAMEGTEMSATAVLRLTENDSVTVVKHTGNSGSQTVLYSDGALYQAEDSTATALYNNAADFQWDNGKLWVLTDEGTLYCDGIETENAAPTLRYTNLLTRSGETILVGETAISLTTDRALTDGNALASITDDQGNAWTGSIDGYKLTIATQELTAGQQYTVTVPADAVENHFGKGNETISLTFTYLSRLTDGATSLLEGDDRAVTVLASGSVSDDGAAADRAWTEERFNREYTEFQNKGYDTVFFGNVILNRFTDNNVEKWLRIQAPNASTYTRMGIGGNYWGTAGMSEAAAKLAIDKQIIDYNDYQDYADLIEGEYLTEMPETVWPVAARAGILNSAGEETDTIGRETVTFFVEFNTDMDTETPLQVRFGSSYPYADYEVDGQWVSPRRWEGSTSITTVIGNGRQYWSIAEGRSAKGWKVYKDWGRFSFTIDTTAALAMTMQGAADDNGITLTWEQDDFDTLAGYNVYRAEYEDGNYVKLNSSVIPAETKTFSDTNVTPGKVYYYNFTVVQTDLSESQPSGKISIRAKDTMAPSIYHDGVYQAFTGSNLVISATVKDNVQVARVTLFYREAEGQWRSADMTHINDKFSAIIPAAYLTTEGLEYYIEAFDGVNFTRKGTAESPYTVTVQQAIDRNSLGDVDGDGRISVLDALLVLQARNDLVNLNQEQFARADLDGNGELTAYEALRILQYANGSIGSVTA